jgi:hypothetical protein
LPKSFKGTANSYKAKKINLWATKSNQTSLTKHKIKVSKKSKRLTSKQCQIMYEQFRKKEDNNQFAQNNNPKNKKISINHPIIANINTKSS